MLIATTLLAFILVGSVAGAGDPAIPGHHPLTQNQAGSVLISEFRCYACHTGKMQSSVPMKIAPDLSEVGTRVASEFLQRFVESPLTAHPGTTMPDVLGSRTVSERSAIAKAITHFLIAQSTGTPLAEAAGPVDRQRGNELFHSVGCVACHGPRDTTYAAIQNFPRNYQEFEEEGDVAPELALRSSTKPNAIPLEHVAAKYTVESLSEFLFQPLRVRRAGRMPDMKLTRAESLAIAGYLVGEQTPTDKVFIPDTVLVETGKRYFQELNCVACHAVSGMEAAPPIGPLETADLTRGCMSRMTDAAAKNIPSPIFNLEPAQRNAIAAAIGDEQTDSDEIVLAKTLTAFRCIACHVRDDYGGVHESHNLFFQGNELNLGDDGRIPPPLTLMGSKLQPAWMKKVLFDGESVRHYMLTRMPQYDAKQYGESVLQRLPELFRRLDVLSGPELKIPTSERRNEDERQHEKLIRAAGRELLGDKGANCVACHSFNGKAATVNQGIDLLTSYERLQPAWFYRYLIRPGSFRPRTVMPTAWPDGQSVFTTILEGNTDRQIAAIWYYLSLGTSAADPPGVRAVNTRLEVGDQAVVYRGRSRIAGFRGIAVGLPEKMNYAFNAETGTLSAIWQGDFVDVNWSGQGAGDFNPAVQPVTLAQDVSFVMLAEDTEPWPVLPVMTKEAPTNPDPLYPKNVGYQFRGYYLDESSIPTFQYRSDAIEIEDRSIAMGSNPQQQRLKRELHFDSPSPQIVWFRALTGNISIESERDFRNDRLRLHIPETDTKMRLITKEPRLFELLLRLQIPQGKSSMELQYELLTK
ncbi:MAG: hypothetical protein KDB03_24320 [Planctomycetales bacterium]|nr:hypothetical protein [Planctomycetales bacterium]